MLSAARLAAASLLLLLALPARAQDTDPVQDDLKASEWVKIRQTDPSARKRTLAVVALGKIAVKGNYKEAIPELTRALRFDNSPAVRASAAAAIGDLKADDARKAEAEVIEALKTEKETKVKRAIAAAVAHFPELAKKAVEPITPMLKDADAATRAAAAEALASAGADAKGAANDLLALLADPEKATRQAAANALGRIAPDNPSFAAAALIKAMAADKDAEFRREVLVSLGLLGDKSAAVVTALAGALADPDEENRAVAVRTLGTFGTAAKPAADALLKFAGTSPDKAHRIDAVRAFGSALGPELKARVGEFLALLEKEPEFEVRVAVLEEVGALGNEVKDDKETMAALRKRLSDPQAKVREAAAAAIRRIEKKTEKKEPEKKQ